MSIPVVVTIHSESEGTDPDCPGPVDDQRDDGGPWIDLAGFKCEPASVANGPYPYRMEGKWNDHRRTFQFGCSVNVNDFAGTGNLTLAGHLAAS